ncbi:MULTISPECIES: T9SS type A sorting domain-containing protein [unclassified Saccharicrinis]|uniref:T9SS type A sorting domain-containing protein n=1 Tax=unclassified Saccharicrinis TaxID=2646859 RepID=UPI003D351FCB
MKKIFFIMVTFLITMVSHTQTILEEGDIAFIAINSDGSTDDFSFVLLNNVVTDTKINFTDNGWTATGEFNSEYPESHFTWTASSEVLAGEVIRVKTYNGVQLPEASNGVITGDKMTLSVAGDQILAYQGEKSNPRFIAGINYNQNWIDKPQDSFDEHSYSNSTSDLPPNLTIGVDAVHVYHGFSFVENDNAMYTCAKTMGTKEELLVVINNVENWDTDNSTPFAQDPFPCSFTVDEPTVAELISIEDMGIYPLPASTDLTLKVITNTDLQGFIYNSTGMQVKQFIYPAYRGDYRINIADLPNGMYILKLQNPRSDLSKKLIIQH